jgi:hypothetical protein
MAFIGGDITEITCNHPTLGQFTFLPKAGEDSTYDLGGVSSADDAQMIAGDAQVIRQLTRKRWSFEATLANDFVAGGADTLQQLQDLAGSVAEGDWTITNINGSVYQGKGSPVGDLTTNGNTSTIALKVAGGGTMKKIA